VNLDGLESREVAFLHLTSPRSPFDPLKTDDGEKVGLMIWSADSSAMQSLDRDLMDRRLAAAAKPGGNRGVTIKASEVFIETKERLIASVSEVINISISDRQVTSSREDIEELFRRFPWIEAQVADFFGNRESFLISAA